MRASQFRAHELEFQISRIEIVVLSGFTDDPGGGRADLFGRRLRVRVHQTEIGGMAARQTANAETEPALGVQLSMGLGQCRFAHGGNPPESLYENKTRTKNSFDATGHVFAEIRDDQQFGVSTRTFTTGLASQLSLRQSISQNFG